MSRHKAQARRGAKPRGLRRQGYQPHQINRLIKYRFNLIRLWIQEQKADLPDIIQQLRNR